MREKLKSEGIGFAKRKVDGCCKKDEWLSTAIPRSEEQCMNGVFTTSDEDEEVAVSNCFKGVFRGGLQNRKHRRFLAGWPVLKDERLQCFKPTQRTSPEEESMLTKQRSSVAECGAGVERLMAVVQRTDERWRKGEFIAGIKEKKLVEDRHLMSKKTDTEMEVNWIGPSNLDLKGWLTQQIDAEYWALRKVKRPIYFANGLRTADYDLGSTHLSAQTSAHLTISKFVQPVLTFPEATTNTNSNSDSHSWSSQSHTHPGFKKPSSLDFQARPDQGLGFRSGERNDLNHPSRFKQLRILLVYTEDDDERASHGEQSEDMRQNCRA